MDKAVDVRYPFESIFDFLGGGYGFRLEGSHLALGLLLVVVGSVLCHINSGRNYLRTISILYFCLQPFNNPAFTIFELSFADICGIIIAIACIINFYIKEVRVPPIATAFFAFATVASIHAAFVWTIYPEFLLEASPVVRYTIIAKIFVFTFNFCWIYTTQEIKNYFIPLIKSLSLFVVFICSVYIWQLAVFAFGTIPYGSFSGAGYSFAVSFGGVSIERGHLSKFMAPLLCPVLIYTFLKRSYTPSILYFLVMTINFSASGISFLVVQASTGVVIFWQKAKKLIFSWTGAMALGSAVALMWHFAEAYGAIVEKIYTLAIRGDESQGGGRSIALFLRYLTEFPLGIGYSGSTFRTAPGLPEINMGIYAFITQMSFLSAIFLLLLGSAILQVLYQFAKGSVVSRLLLVGAIAMPFVYSADILWFVPLWWAPLFFLLSYRREFYRITDKEWAQLACQKHPKTRQVSC